MFTQLAPVPAEEKTVRIIMLGVWIGLTIYTWAASYLLIGCADLLCDIHEALVIGRKI